MPLIVPKTRPNRVSVYLAGVKMGARSSVLGGRSHCDTIRNFNRLIQTVERFETLFLTLGLCVCTRVERERGWSIVTQRSLRSVAAKRLAALYDLWWACSSALTSFRRASDTHRHCRRRHPADRRPSLDPRRLPCHPANRLPRLHTPPPPGQWWRHVWRATRRRRPPSCPADHVPCHVTSWRCCARSLPPRFNASCRWRHRHPSPQLA